MSASLLVIEDDDNLREIVAETLQDAGYTVLQASGADEAIQLSRRHVFDLILADVRMAGSVDGVGAVEQIKRLQPKVRSVIMTGFASAEVPVRAAAIQADDYLLKGDTWFGMDELLRVIRRTLDREERRDPGLLARLLAIPGKLLDVSLKGLLEAKLPDLEQERQQFLQRFYLLIRPGHLSKEVALKLWGQLEMAEKAFSELTRPDQVEASRALYRSLGADLNAPDPGPGKPASELPPYQFYAFYQKIREGKIELPQFERAARLRLDAQARRESVEAFALHHWLWAEPLQRDLEGFSGCRVGEFLLHEIFLFSDRMEGFCCYRATDLGEMTPFLVRAIVAGTEARELFATAQSAGIQMIEERDALFFVEPWPWPIQGQQVSLRYLLDPNGMSLSQALKFLRPVFLHVIEEHRRGMFTGTLIPEDIYLAPDGRLVIRFDAIRWNRDPNLLEPRRSAALQMTYQSFVAPEMSTRKLSPLSDQYCLGMLLLNFLHGELSPSSFLVLQARAKLGNRAFLQNHPAAQENPGLESLLARLVNHDPNRRFPSLAVALEALENLVAVRS